LKRDVPDEPTFTYATSELSKYYAITGKGLAFYEGKGLISPARQSNGKYREYSLTDCYHLYFSKFYRNCGLKLDQLIGLINDGKLQDIGAKIQLQAQAIDDEAQYKKRLAERLRQIADKLRNLPGEVNVFHIEERPEMYRLFVRNYNGPHESSPEQSKEFSLWNKSIPINVASLRYPCDDLMAGCSNLNTGIGNIILAEDFEFLRFKKSKRVQYLPRTRCLRTIIQIEPRELDSIDPLQPALKYLHDQGLRLTGDPLTAMLVIAAAEKGEMRYDEAWLPVGE
jgi:DNA-binding transcriptional MerR regulator